MGIGAKIKKALRRVGSAISGAYKDVGKLLDQYVVKPIEKDPLGFILTAAAATFGIPGLIGPGAIASGLTSTAVNLAQGKDFNDALKAGVTAGVTNFAFSEATNLMSDTPAPFGSSLGSVDKAPLIDSIFSDTPSKTALDAASSNFQDTLSLDNSSNLGGANPADDLTAALRPDEINAMSDGSSMDFGNYADDVNANNIETYLTPDDQLAYARNPNDIPYTDVAPRYEPKNYLSDVSSNEFGSLPDIPETPTSTYTDAANEYWKVQPSKAVTNTPVSTDYNWWEHPIDSLGKYSKDTIGVDITNPWIVGGGLMGLNYYEKKKAAEEEARRQQEARANDPVNSPLFTARLQQYRLDRNKNRYTGDINRYGQRNNTNSGEFQFYDPAVYTPVEAATGGQIRAPYYTYGNVPPSVKEYKSGGLSALSDGRSDDIPAVLSDGEYVMDAETVALLGNGSSDAGAKQLDHMRASLRKQKGKALSKGKFSPNAKSPLAYLQRG